MKRKRNFIEEFTEYGQAFITSPAYLRWTAHWLLGISVSRNVALRARGSIYPNLYVLLTGAPGAGKSQAVDAARRVLGKANRLTNSETNFKLMPDSVTRAAVEDYLKDNVVTRYDTSGAFDVRNECLALSDEIYGILPEHDLGHLTLYNQLFDNKATYQASTRTHGDIDLMRPYCAILTGVQPGFLAETMPEGAWSMGFMSRSILVHSRRAEKKSLLEAHQPDDKLELSLAQYLGTLTKTFGLFTWTHEAKATIDSWWMDAQGQPLPEEPKLVAGYNDRRGLHILKLAMTHSLAEGTDLVIEEHHVVDALNFLWDTEKQMSNIFLEMRTAGKSTGIQAIIDMLKMEWAVSRKAIPESSLNMKLLQYMQPTQIAMMVDQLAASGIIRDVSPEKMGRGMRTFAPGKALGELR